ncbi:ABC transporter permease [Pantoea sp. B65]|uniref:ABC transporter permease n=1 Tax=Pantoea sp. B65 TaxID=2813359 RepID=UPI0039B497EC
MNWAIIAENSRDYLNGTLLTLLLTAGALALGFILSLSLALLRNQGSVVINSVISLYTIVFRGTPLLIQLFLIYYGLSQFGFIQTSIFWPWLSSPLFCVLLAFVLNTSAYTTEIFTGSINSLPPGEIEAAKAYGMTYSCRVRRILLPAMLTRSLALYSNEMIMMLHATSLASTVTLMELTGVARNISLNYYIQFEPYATAGVIYLLITLVMVGGFRYAEKRWGKYLHTGRG